MFKVEKNNLKIGNISQISLTENTNREERFAERTFKRQARTPQTKP